MIRGDSFYHHHRVFFSSGYRPVNVILTMSDVYDPPTRIRHDAHVKSMDEYRELYEESVKSPVRFWKKISEQFYWKVAPGDEDFLQYNFNLKNGPIKIEWMRDAKTNLCYNCLDRHLEDHGAQVYSMKDQTRGAATVSGTLCLQIAFYWEGNELQDDGKITFKELHTQVCKFANALKARGIKKVSECYMTMTMRELIQSHSLCRISGGPRRHLHANGGRTCHCNAGVLSHRGHSLDRLWWLQVILL